MDGKRFEEELCSVITELRIERNLKQAVLANVLGITVHGYANLERGRTRISIRLLECLANFYEIPINRICQMAELSQGPSGILAGTKQVPGSHQVRKPAKR